MGSALQDSRAPASRERPVTYRGTVYPWHCDQVGHMNVMWYVGKFDEATWNLFLLAGITPGYLREHRRGMAAVDQHIEYRRELRAGDVVAIRSEVLAMEARKIRFRHEMTNEETGEIAAVTTLLGVHMDTHARKACPFPAGIVERGRQLCVTPAADPPPGPLTHP